MTISSVTKDGGYLVIIEDGITKRRSIVYEDTVCSLPPTGYTEVGVIYVDEPNSKLVIQYNGSTTEIELDATIDLTGVEIVALLEALAASSRLEITYLDDGSTYIRFTVAEQTKLGNIETGATADQTGAEIVALLEALTAGNRLSHTKLDDVGISDHVSGATAGQLLVATAAAVAAWQNTGVKLSAPDISGTVTALAALTLPAFTAGGNIGSAATGYSKIGNSAGAWIISTRNAAQNAALARITINTDADEVAIALANCNLTGLKLGGAQDANSQQINSLADPTAAQDADTKVARDNAISTHAGLGDPHTGYRLESADHTHQTTGAQAGKLDHGAALDGLSGDDHPQYLLVADLIRYFPCVCFDWTVDVATGDGKFYFHIPPALNGMNLVYCHALVITAGTTNTLDIQINNVTDSDGGEVDFLSTKLTVDSGETGSDTAATPYVIDTAKDDVATNDVIRIDVDAVHTTPAKGLIVTLGFQLP